ncbi:hypothetical protein [Halobacterium rubrum]|uniref:hypothetical protein n=1 Tax=Halobacterium TaxID=2239 RepID=UPI001F282DFC|nr:MULTISPECIES: hypothetical protein [Halobacterium]MDH5018855.1 hypothetical protein [Halobacterium rubrum]
MLGRIVRGRPLALWGLCVVLSSLSVRGLAGGAALVADPSGGLVGASTAPLAATPFDTFLGPGVVLFVAFGVAPLATVALVYRRHPRGWLVAAATGVALAVWVAVEVAIGFYRPTVALNLGTAAALVAFAGHPAVRAPASEA